jgi:hypothetical protein
MLDLPLIKNFERTTPEIQVLPHPDGVYKTLTKVSKFQDLAERIEAKVTPHTRRHIYKLACGAIHELTANQLL